MTVQIRPERYEALVIGAGQAGLAAGYHLKRRGIDFAILDANDRIGDNWRTRYDSLRLYSPAKYDGLPGMAFPLSRHAFPTGHEMADYLEAYTQRFDLPVQTGVAVDGLRLASDAETGYVITAGKRRFEAAQVVVATGSFRKPHVPEFAGELDPGIRQLHSAGYRTVSQLADGPVLVVGVSHSGADLALEVARSHRTILSGRSHGELPFSVDSRRGRIAWPVMKFLALNLLTLRTPIGRKMAPNVRRGGGPLLRVRRADLLNAGVEWFEARTVGVRDGKPMLADAGRWSSARRHQRHLVHRLPPRLPMDRLADRRRGRLADAGPRRGDVSARSLLPGHPVPVGIHLDARPRCRPGCRARGAADGCKSRRAGYTCSIVTAGCPALTPRPMGHATPVE